MEYKFNCGNYRHFIVQADNEQQAKDRFEETSRMFPSPNCGFQLKDVTSIEEVKKTNPYPETLIDESSGIEVPDIRYKIWEEGYKAGIKEVLSRAVTDGCLSTVNKKHGVHIPDELYEELSAISKS